MKWEKKKLKDISLKITKGTTPTTYGFKFVENGINFVKAESILEGGGILPETFAFIDEPTNEYLKRSILENKDVLISIAGAKLGKCGFLTEQHLPANTNQAVGIVRINPELAEPKYVYYNFVSKKTYEQVNSLNAQAAQPNLNLGLLGDIEFHFPPLPTQRKIASILSAYDDLIENNLKRIKLLEEKAFASYKLMVKNKKLKLEELYDTGSGGTPSRTNAEYFSGDINWFKSKELADSILLESEEKITEQAVDKSSAKLFPAGSVIMAMYGATIGKLGLLTVPSTTNQACCAIIPKNNLQSNFYILNWLLENREYVLSFRMGAAQENISQQVIRNLMVSVPKEADLQIFNQEVKPTYQLIKNLHQQNTRLREARDILLPKLMNGEIEV